ncbi:hypothetical protein, partial [Streptomyces resistomycificus]
STRMLLAAAGAAAVVGLAAPGAYSAEDDWDHGKSSSGHESSSYTKDRDKGGSHDSPRGGMHTGGGALTVADDEGWATAREPKYDPETYKDSSGGGYSKGGHDKGGKGGHDKPRGGMHTGGGALASPGVTAGGLAALGVLGTGLYAARRNRSAGSPA